MASEYMTPEEVAATLIPAIMDRDGDYLHNLADVIRADRIATIREIERRATDHANQGTAYSASWFWAAREVLSELGVGTPRSVR